MQIRKNSFILTIDKLTSEKCEGWYIRKDGMDNYLVFLIDGKQHPVLPTISRPDVAALEHGDEICGFSYTFRTPLKNGSQLIIKDSNSSEIFNRKISRKEYEPDALNTRLVRLVEPFVEMDIAKVRSALMENRIYDQYRSMFKGILEQKSSEELKKELVNILADMKTTMHLLCAAYLDYTRYKDPEFLISLPEFCPDVTTSFTIDLNGQFTGSGWSEPDGWGRWLHADARTSILMPNPGPGAYQIQVSVNAENQPGLAGLLQISVNDQPCAFVREPEGLPCTLKGTVELCNSPFLAIHFTLPKIKDSEAPVDPAESSIRISEIQFSRIQA